MTKLTIVLLALVCLQLSAKGGFLHKPVGHGPDEIKQTQQKITGRVLSESGEPLAGVSVIVKGSNTGTSTDVNGNFSITVADDAILVFSIVGYEPAEISVSGKTTSMSSGQCR